MILLCNSIVNSQVSIFDILMILRKKWTTNYKSLRSFSFNDWQQILQSFEGKFVVHGKWTTCNNSLQGSIVVVVAQISQLVFLKHLQCVVWLRFVNFVSIKLFIILVTLSYNYFPFKNVEIADFLQIKFYFWLLAIFDVNQSNCWIFKFIIIMICWDVYHSSTN